MWVKAKRKKIEYEIFLALKLRNHTKIIKILKKIDLNKKRKLKILNELHFKFLGKK